MQEQKYSGVNLNGELGLIILIRYCNRNHTVRIYSYFHFKLATTLIRTFEITIIHLQLTFGCVGLNIKHI